MKPGEYIGSDGRAHNVRSVMLDELDDACNSATMQLNGGAWLTYKKHLLPSHPDFPLAVAALQALIRPSLDPRAGRVLAMREDGPYRFIANEREYEVAADGWLTTNMTLAWCAIQTIFEAGRRYERELGCAYVSDKPWTHQS